MENVFLKYSFTWIDLISLPKRKSLDKKTNSVEHGVSPGSLYWDLIKKINKYSFQPELTTQQWIFRNLRVKSSGLTGGSGMQIPIVSKGEGLAKALQKWAISAERQISQATLSFAWFKWY